MVIGLSGNLLENDVARSRRERERRRPGEAERIALDAVDEDELRARERLDPVHEREEVTFDVLRLPVDALEVGSQPAFERRRNFRRIETRGWPPGSRASCASGGKRSPNRERARRRRRDPAWNMPPRPTSAYSSSSGAGAASSLSRWVTKKMSWAMENRPRTAKPSGATDSIHLPTSAPISPASAGEQSRLATVTTEEGTRQLVGPGRRAGPGHCAKSSVNAPRCPVTRRSSEQIPVVRTVCGRVSHVAHRPRARSATRP